MVELSGGIPELRNGNVENNEFNGKKVSILGLGRSGVALSKILRKCGADVFVSDENISVELESRVRELLDHGIRGELGAHSDAVYKGRDILVVSPGISMYHPVLEVARKEGITVMGEVEVAYRLSKSPIIAVTGTNGKSTTVTLLHQVLCDAGRKAILAGNIGKPLVGEIFDNPHSEWIVAEISSFQLETTIDFRPRIGVLLNITDDHRDRHRSLEEYVAKKSRLFENQKKEDFSVFNDDDETVRAVARNVTSEKYYFSLTHPVSRGSFASDGVIYWENGAASGRVLSLEENPLRGAHNLENILATITVAKIAGISDSVIAESLRSFTALRHRLEYVATIKGVDFIDDSKGTNPGAVIAALGSFDRPVILIAGGKDKDMDFTGLGAVIAGKTKMLVVIGESSQKIAAATRECGMNRIYEAQSLREALHESFDSAEPGDIVLLSPSCASFDMFKSAEDRGDKFREIVQELEVENR